MREFATGYATYSVFCPCFVFHNRIKGRERRKRERVKKRGIESGGESEREREKVRRFDRNKISLEKNDSQDLVGFPRITT